MGMLNIIENFIYLDSYAPRFIISAKSHCALKKSSVSLYQKKLNGMFIYTLIEEKTSSLNKNNQTLVPFIQEKKFTFLPC